MTVVLYNYYCYDYDRYHYQSRIHCMAIVIINIIIFYYHYFDKNNGSLYIRYWQLYNPDIIVSFYMHIYNYHHFIATVIRVNCFNLLYFNHHI